METGKSVNLGIDQSEELTENILEKSKQSFRNLCNIKRSNICVTGVPKKEEKD